MARIDRRQALTLLGGLIATGTLPERGLAGSPQCPSVAPPPTDFVRHRGPSLGALARAKGLQFGLQAQISTDRTVGDGIYDKAYMGLLLSEEPDFVAYGNQFLFSTVVPDPPIGGHLMLTNEKYNIANTWQSLDDTAPALMAAHVRARADALIWENGQVRQPWLRPIARNSSPDRRANADLDWNLSRMEDYIRIAFAKINSLDQRMPGFFNLVSLVNEPLDYWGRGIGKLAYRGGAFCPKGIPIDEEHGVIGYIRDAYTLAARLRGTAKGAPKLILNEASTEDDQFSVVTRPGLLKLLKMMKAEGIPLDGVGLEAHLQPQMMANPLKPDWGRFGAFLDEIADLGLEIHITELDVFDFITSCNGRPGKTAESDALTALYFETFLDRTLQCRAVKSITPWDFSDRYSFYRSFDVGSWYGYDKLEKGRAPETWPKCAKMPIAPDAIACPRATPYDDAYRPKSARTAMARAFERAPSRA